MEILAEKKNNMKQIIKLNKNSNAFKAIKKVTKKAEEKKMIV